MNIQAEWFWRKDQKFCIMWLGLKIILNGEFFVFFREINFTTFFVKMISKFLICNFFFPEFHWYLVMLQPIASNLPKLFWKLTNVSISYTKWPIMNFFVKSHGKDWTVWNTTSILCLTRKLISLTKNSFTNNLGFFY